MPLWVVVTLACVAALIAAPCRGSPAADPYFPAFHVRPEANWINDPNGPMYDPNNDMYHLWMQYNPAGPTWGNMSWYHVVSKDLVFFQRIGVTLRNDATYDVGGVFSGSASVFDSGNTMVILYTCVDVNGTQRQCVATPEDTADPNLSIWIKSDANPVVSVGPAPQNGLTNFRDPTTAWATTKNDKGPYRLAVGTSLAGTPPVAAVALYDTPDLTSRFNFTGFLTTGVERSGMYECPDYFPVGSILAPGSAPAAANVFALKTSNEWVRQDFITIGTDQTFTTGGSLEKFTPTCLVDSSPPDPQDCPSGPAGAQSYLVDFGQWYASKSFWDPVSKRRVVWGWIAEDDTAGAQRGWQGVQSLPRQLSYDVNTSRFLLAPIPELAALFNQTLASSATPVPFVHGATLCGANCTDVLQQQLDIVVSVPFTALQGYDWRIGVNVLTSNLSATTSTFVGLIGPSSTYSGSSDTVCMYGTSGAYAALTTVATSADCRARCVTDGRCNAWTMTSTKCYLISKQLTTTPDNAQDGVYCGTTSSVVFGVDRTRSGTTGNVAPNVGPVRVVQRDPTNADNAIINISVFVDHSVVEGFFNGGAGRVASRVYNPFATGIVTLVASTTSSTGGASVALQGLTLLSASVRSVKSIWVTPEPMNPPSGAVAVVITACVVGAFLAIGGVASLRQLRRERQKANYARVA